MKFEDYLEKIYKICNKKHDFRKPETLRHSELLKTIKDANTVATFYAVTDSEFSVASYKKFTKNLLKLVYGENDKTIHELLDPSLNLIEKYNKQFANQKPTKAQVKKAWGKMLANVQNKN